MSENTYNFTKEIGKGSYGTVWLVKHKNEDKQYVMKRIDLRKASQKELLAAQQEAQLLSEMKHPNIVGYRESFKTPPSTLNIVMSFCEGGDLYNRLKQQHGEYLPERQIVEWFIQITMALQYMHDKDILHRDLKTQNIFLTKTKIIKLGDFGIARVLESNTDMASTLVGTPYYMSPELFSNKPYNHKSDVWALGCCVYEMCTLRHAFSGKNMNSLVLKILKGKAPPMPDQYDKQLTSLIKLMLNYDPARRPDVKKLLKNDYIRSHIKLFLENTRKTSASRGPKSSGLRHVVSTPALANGTKSVNPAGSLPAVAVSEPKPSVPPRRSAVGQKKFIAPIEEADGTGKSVASVGRIDLNIDTAKSDNVRANNLSARARRRLRVEEETRATREALQQSAELEMDGAAQPRSRQARTVSDGAAAAMDVGDAKDGEMDKLADILDTTLAAAPKMSVSDDTDEATLVANDDRPPAPAPDRAMLRPGAETLASTGRLSDRITNLRKDLIRGVGVEKMKRAYDILDDFIDDDSEMEV